MPARRCRSATTVPMEQAALLGCAALTGVGAVLNAARPGARLQRARDRRRRRRPVRRPGRADRGRGRDPRRRPGRGAARAGARARRDPRVRARRRARGDRASSTRKASTTPSTRSARAATTKLALRWTRGGGTAVVVGLPAGGEKLELDPFEFSNREKTLTGTIYGSEDPAVALPQLLDLVALGRARAREPRRPVVPARPRRRRVHAPASRASPAACSSLRRIGAWTSADNVWDVDWGEPGEYQRGCRGRRLRRRPRHGG